MELLSDKVTLQDFPNYRGGLDVKYGQTGQFSYYTNFKNRYAFWRVAKFFFWSVTQILLKHIEKHVKINMKIGK